MKKIFMALFALMACVSMSAQDEVQLKIDDFTIAPGESKTITLDLENGSNEVSGIKCDILLPEGITIDQEDDEYLFDFDTTTKRTTYKKHSIECALQENGAVRIIIVSTGAKVISGTTGAVVDIPVTASATIAEGTYTLKLTNLDITNSTGTVTYKTSDYTGTVTVTSTASINDVNSNNVEAVYNVNGQKMEKVQRGMNIVRQNDGTTMKIVKK